MVPGTPNGVVSLRIQSRFSHAGHGVVDLSTKFVLISVVLGLGGSTAGIRHATSRRCRSPASNSGCPRSSSLTEPCAPAGEQNLAASRSQSPGMDALLAQSPLFILHWN